MAKLNNMYIFVQDEDMSYGAEITEHAVEKGIDIADHVKRRGVTLTLSGEIVGENAASTLAKIKQMHQQGIVCNYVGRTTLSNCLIADFSTSHPNTIWGGCEFSMTLKEIRTASTSYKSTNNTSAQNKTKETKNTGTQQTEKNSKTEYVYHTVKKGDTIWALVAAGSAPYKNLSRPTINRKSYSACDWVMQKNQSAFSKKGDFRTLQIGKKIIVGVRNGSGSGSSGGNTAPKQYSVTIQLSGNKAYFNTVVVTYTSGGKKKTLTKGDFKTFIVKVDSGTTVKVDCREKVGTGKVVSVKQSGATWKRSGDIFTASSVKKTSLIGVGFYKK